MNKMPTWITWSLFFIAFIYNLLDAWHTTLLLSVGAHEVNPIIAFIIDHSGTVQSIWFVKIAVFAVLAALMCLCQSKFKKGK